MATLKGFGRRVGHGVVVGTNGVLEADLAAPAKVVGSTVTSVVGGARAKAHQARETRKMIKVARKLSDIMDSGDPPSVLSPEVFAQVRSINAAEYVDTVAVG